MITKEEFKSAFNTIREYTKQDSNGERAVLIAFLDNDGIYHGTMYGNPESIAEMLADLAIDNSDAYEVLVGAMEIVDADAKIRERESNIKYN